MNYYKLRFQEVIGDRYRQIPTDLAETLEKDPAVPKNLLLQAYRCCALPIATEKLVESGIPILPLEGLGSRDRSTSERLPRKEDLTAVRTYLQDYFAIAEKRQRVTDLVRPPQ